MAEAFPSTSNDDTPKEKQPSIRCGRCKEPLFTNDVMVCDTVGVQQGRPRFMVVYCCMNNQCKNFIPLTRVTHAIQVSKVDHKTGEKTEREVVLHRSSVLKQQKVDVEKNDDSDEMPPLED